MLTVRTILPTRPVAKRQTAATESSQVGLGDVVHLVAAPVAKAIDKVAGTNLQNCSGCNRRRETLNKIKLS